MALQERFTVVQDSRYGYPGKPDPQYEHALEVRRVTFKYEKDRVVRANGLIFPDYAMARMYAEKEMQQLKDGMPGRFANERVDGLRIYVPTNDPRVVTPLEHAI
jgi:hypothetical protein